MRRNLKGRSRVTPPMVVTYRLTGVDGEATEERYEQVEAQDDGREENRTSRRRPSSSRRRAGWRNWCGVVLLEMRPS